MKKMNRIISFLAFSLVLYSCDKSEDSVLLLDESELIGRWEPFSKSIIYKDGRDIFTEEDVCEWYDTYTFFENGRLRYADGIKVDEGLCGDNPELENEGNWNQDIDGKFTFTINKTDGTLLTLKPKDFYFVKEEPFLILEYFEENLNSEVAYYSTSFGKLN